jgi:hypothetical protein
MQEGSWGQGIFRCELRCLHGAWDPLNQMGIQSKVQGGTVPFTWSSAMGHWRWQQLQLTLPWVTLSCWSLGLLWWSWSRQKRWHDFHHPCPSYLLVWRKVPHFNRDPQTSGGSNGCWGPEGKKSTQSSKWKLLTRISLPGLSGKKAEYLQLTPSLESNILLILSAWSSGERTKAWQECGKMRKGLGMRWEIGGTFSGTQSLFPHRDYPQAHSLVWARLCKHLGEACDNLVSGDPLYRFLYINKKEKIFGTHRSYWKPGSRPSSSSHPW